MNFFFPRRLGGRPSTKSTATGSWWNGAKSTAMRRRRRWSTGWNRRWGRASASAPMPSSSAPTSGWNGPPNSVGRIHHHLRRWLPSITICCFSWNQRICFRTISTDTKTQTIWFPLQVFFFSWWFFCWKFRYLHRKWFLQVLVLSGSAHIDIEKWVINYELKQNHRHANKDRAGILLDSVHSDLVDVIWTKARPSVSHRPVFVHDLSYAGKHVLVQSKPLVSLVKHRCHR